MYVSSRLCKVERSTRVDYSQDYFTVCFQNASAEPAKFGGTLVDIDETIDAHRKTKATPQKGEVGACVGRALPVHVSTSTFFNTNFSY